MNDKELMMRAIRLSEESVKNGGGPFGAVIAKIVGGRFPGAEIAGSAPDKVPLEAELHRAVLPDPPPVHLHVIGNFPGPEPGNRQHLGGGRIAAQNIEIKGLLQ